METIDKNLSSGGLRITPELNDELGKTAQYARILAIIGFGNLAIMLFTFIKLVGSLNVMFFGGVTILFFLIIMVLVFFSSFYLWGFSSEVKSSVSSDDRYRWTKAWGRLAAYYRLWGILLLGVLSILVLLFLISLF